MRVETLPLSEHAVLTAYLHSDSPRFAGTGGCVPSGNYHLPRRALCHSVQMLSVTCRQFPF